MEHILRLFILLKARHFCVVLVLLHKMDYLQQYGKKLKL